MGRAAQHKTKIITGLVVALLASGGVGLGLTHHHHSTPPPVSSVKKAAPITDVRYSGITGQTALSILKNKHKVLTKSSSYGEFVTTIDGTAGNGPKYWTFYVNGTQANVGAGAYQTKPTDHIEWKLQ